MYTVVNRAVIRQLEDGVFHRGGVFVLVTLGNDVFLLESDCNRLPPTVRRTSHRRRPHDPQTRRNYLQTLPS